MPREARLPPVFADYSPRYTQRVSETEWSSTCPACGGDVHPDGEWPDRCRWFTRGKIVGWCRQCHSLFWPGKHPNLEGLETWRKEQEAREEQRKRSAERALEGLRRERFWLRYHEEMGDTGREYWERRGVPRSFQDWWQLGYCQDRSFYLSGQNYITDSATIPIFAPGWKAHNVKHRLIEAPSNHGKYRYELRSQRYSLWHANPELGLSGSVCAVEGEIKAMVVFAKLDDAATNVVGLPGATLSKEMLALFDDVERVTLVMDPDARKQAWAIVKRLGRKRCRVLIPPMKIDDGIIASHMTKRELGALMRTAVPA